MALLRYILICILLGLLTGCHFTYLIKGGYYQAKILSRQVSIESVIADANTKPEVRKKLELLQDVFTFIEHELGLETKGNYRKFVQLDDKYVSYAVTAAEKFKLEAYLWKFPIVGAVPYKGYFVKADADEEAAEMSKDGFDTSVRGVSAYSTLGWIRDPILSSMLNYRDEDFVNLIIHETVHANLYIKNASDFNEQLATFLGNKGSEAYYKSNQTLKTSAFKYVQDSAYDEKLFSDFLSRELKELDIFYTGQLADKENSLSNKEVAKKSRLAQIQKKFKSEIQSKLKTNAYTHFGSSELNNAILISYKTYLMDLSDFDRIFEKHDHNFRNFFAFCKSLEKSDDPQKAFRNN